MERNYSFFPALVLVLTAFAVSLGVEVFAGFKQRELLRQQEEALAKVLPEAQRINSTMTALTRDLLALAPHSAGARKIVEDMRIQAVQRPAPTPAPSK